MIRGLETSAILFLSAILIVSSLPIGGGTIPQQPNPPILTNRPIRVSADDDYSSSRPEVAVDSNNYIYVVWEDHKDYVPDYYGGSEIYFAKSTNGGHTWSQEKRISASGPSDPYSFSQYPHIAVGLNGEIYVVWSHQHYGYRANEVFFTKSTDGGETWSEEVMISEDDWLYSEVPRIAVGPNGDIHVVWHNRYYTPQPSRSIYYTKSTDGGETWTDSIMIAAPDQEWSALFYPDIAVDSRGRIHVVWTYESYEQCRPYYSRSEDGGQNWTEPAPIDDYLSFGHWWDRPRIRTDSNDDVHVAFIRRDPETGDERVSYNATRDHGNEFRPEYVVELSGPAPRWVDGPDIAVGPGGYVYVVWRAPSGNPVMDPLIHYAKCKVGTTSWFFYDRDTGQTGYDSYSSSTAVAEDSHGRSHVVWSNGAYSLPNYETSIWYYYTAYTYAYPEIQ